MQQLLQHIINIVVVIWTKIVKILFKNTILKDIILFGDIGMVHHNENYTMIIKHAKNMEH